MVMIVHFLSSNPLLCNHCIFYNNRAEKLYLILKLETMVDSQAIRKKRVA